MRTALQDVSLNSSVLRVSDVVARASSPEPGSLQPSVAIIIVNWNGWQDTIDCLDTLLSQNYNNYVVIVVDNDSSDHSVERIAGWCDRPYRTDGSSDFPGVSRITDSIDPKHLLYQIAGPCTKFELREDCRIFIVRSGGNLGFAGGCNFGANFVGDDEFDYLWFLNSDTVVHQRALAELVATAANTAQGGMTGSTLLYYRRPTLVQALGGADLDMLTCVIRHRGEGVEYASLLDNHREGKSLTYIVGASMLVPVSLIDTIGAMQEDYFLYYEEVDWAFRARGRYSQIYSAKSIVYHKAGASSKDKVSEFSMRLLFGNKLAFFRRHIPQLNAQLRIAMLKDFVRHVVKGRWRSARVLVKVVAGKRRTYADPALLVQ